MTRLVETIHFAVGSPRRGCESCCAIQALPIDLFAGPGVVAKKDGAELREDVEEIFVKQGGGDGRASLGVGPGDVVVRGSAGFKRDIAGRAGLNGPQGRAAECCTA